MARNRDELRNDPEFRQAAADHRDDLLEVVARDLAYERQQPSVEQQDRLHAARRRVDRLEGELVENTGREGRRDTVLDGDRTNDSPLDERTRAVLQRTKERLRAERDTEQLGRQPGGVAQALVHVCDLFKDRAERSRDSKGRGR
ncbi:MAG: hypothetical protein M3N43_07045 [Actinomycetota bacterium]|nr:hypothetical protein [Actinomycetota bacterium]